MNMGKIDKTFADSEFIKDHDRLNFDNILTKETEAKLTFKVNDSVFEYLSPEGNISSALFKPTTSEYKILTFLMNHRNSVETSDLTEQLNDPRKEAEGADDKQRARDKIKAITKKLGKGLIKKTKDGYIIDCKIVRI